MTPRFLVVATVLVLGSLACAPEVRAQSCEVSECMQNGVCQIDGTCKGTPRPNGTSCNDGNDCTTNDQCQAGTCLGTADPAMNGQPCTLGGGIDLGLCAPNPTCLAFGGFAVCVPESFVECEETDTNECTFDVCNPETGQCTVVNSSCFGECGSCDPATGECTLNPKPNGSACDDFNVCTANDGCSNGQCVSGGGTGPTATATVAGSTPTRTATAAAATPTRTVTPASTSTRTPTATVALTATRTPTRTATLPAATATATAAQAACFGDCNGNGSLTASDIGRINSTILRCSPCAGGVAGGVATGCAGIAGGCVAADFNGDGCIRASELGRANQNILRHPPNGCPLPTP